MRLDVHKIVLTKSCMILRMWPHTTTDSHRDDWGHYTINGPLSMIHWLKKWREKNVWNCPLNLVMDTLLCVFVYHFRCVFRTRDDKESLYHKISKTNKHRSVWMAVLGPEVFGKMFQELEPLNPKPRPPQLQFWPKSNEQGSKKHKWTGKMGQPAKIKIEPWTNFFQTLGGWKDKLFIGLDPFPKFLDSIR